MSDCKQSNLATELLFNILTKPSKLATLVVSKKGSLKVDRYFLDICESWFRKNCWKLVHPEYNSGLLNTSGFVGK